jgi:hypothetical protein
MKESVLFGLVLCAVVSCGETTSSGQSAEELRTCTPTDGSLDQEDLSSFDGCQRLDGSIVLRHALSDRTNLGTIVVVTRNVVGGGYVGDPLKLEGLDSLEVIEGAFGFFVDNLQSFSGVPKLRSVGSFQAVEVPQVEDFRGLESLREVHGHLDISFNPKLRSLEGLESLERVHGDLTINDNPLLPASEVDALLERVTVDGDVGVW